MRRLSLLCQCQSQSVYLRIHVTKMRDSCMITFIFGCFQIVQIKIVYQSVQSWRFLGLKYFQNFILGLKNLKIHLTTSSTIPYVDPFPVSDPVCILEHILEFIFMNLSWRVKGGYFYRKKTLETLSIVINGPQNRH